MKAKIINFPVKKLAINKSSQRSSMPAPEKRHCATCDFFGTEPTPEGGWCGCFYKAVGPDWKCTEWRETEQ